MAITDTSHHQGVYSCYSWQVDIPSADGRDYRVRRLHGRFRRRRDGNAASSELDVRFSVCGQLRQTVSTSKVACPSTERPSCPVIACGSQTVCRARGQQRLLQRAGQHQRLYVRLRIPAHTSPWRWTDLRDPERRLTALGPAEPGSATGPPSPVEGRNSHQRGRQARPV